MDQRGPLTRAHRRELSSRATGTMRASAALMHRALIVLLLAVTAGCPARKHREAPEAARAPAAPQVDRAKEKQIEDARQQALAVAIATPPPVTDAPCAHVPIRSPAPLGEMSLAWHDDMAGRPGDNTYGYLLVYLRLIGSYVEVVSAPGAHAPLGGDRIGFDGPLVTLVIDHWTDPDLPATGEGQFTSGELMGRVLVWDPAAKAFTCAAAVTAENTHVTVVTTDPGGGETNYQEDPLSKARVDLVNEALRAGLGGLHAIKI
jgi:hypothetical protein